MEEAKPDGKEPEPKIKDSEFGGIEPDPKSCDLPSCNCVGPCTCGSPSCNFKLSFCTFSNNYGDRFVNNKA